MSNPLDGVDNPAFITSSKEKPDSDVPFAQVRQKKKHSTPEHEHTKDPVKPDRAKNKTRSLEKRTPEKSATKEHDSSALDLDSENTSSDQVHQSPINADEDTTKAGQVVKKARKNTKKAGQETLETEKGITITGHDVNKAGQEVRKTGHVDKKSYQGVTKAGQNVSTTDQAVTKVAQDDRKISNDMQNSGRDAADVELDAEEVGHGVATTVVQYNNKTGQVEIKSDQDATSAEKSPVSTGEDATITEQGDTKSGQECMRPIFTTPTQHTINNGGDHATAPQDDKTAVQDTTETELDNTMTERDVESELCTINAGETSKTADQNATIEGHDCIEANIASTKSDQEPTGAGLGLLMDEDGLTRTLRLSSLTVTMGGDDDPDGDSDDDDAPGLFTTLGMAVKNDSPQSVEKLLENCTSIQMFSALLFSINLGRHDITKLFLDHPKYTDIRQVTELMKKGALQEAMMKEADDEEADEADDSVLDADITPLMLAAQRNQFEVVDKLLAKGETIDNPHHTGCRCATCKHNGMDELRQAKTQLTTFRALASDSYMILANKDPIYSAFEMGQKLSSLSMSEKHYKAEYLSLVDQVGELSGRILDRVRDGSELDIILNEKYGTASSHEMLARLSLAIANGEKKFVAHSTCQKKLASLWIGHLNPKWVATPIRAVLFFFAFIIFYPLAVIIYWIYPFGKVGRFLQIPIIKFMANTASYIVFVVLMVGYGTEQPPRVGDTLCSHHDPVGPHCRAYMEIIDTNSSYINGTTILVRHHQSPAGTYIFVIWLLGLTWENMKKIGSERGMYFSKLFNILDFIQILLFIASFSLSFSAVGRVNSSLRYFSKWETWVALADNDEEAVDMAYWLNADRTTWTTYDPTIIGEAVMAIASLLTVAKLTNVFTINEKIGPLLLTLAKMIEDMTAFSVVFMFLVGSFVVGFHNLFFFWYTSSQIAFGIQKEGDDPINDLQSITQIITTCFWSIFGMADLGDSTFYTYPGGHVTTITGHVMFAFYNWMMVIILINMLIAMMSRSYDIIAETEDTEWKFARTKLFMEYIREGSTLATPFNLVPTWKGILIVYRNFANNWCYRMAGRTPPDIPKDNEATDQKRVQSTASLDTYIDAKSNGNRTNHTKRNPMGNVNVQIKNMENKSRHRRAGKHPSKDYLEVIDVVKKRVVTSYGAGDGDEKDEIAEGLEQLKSDMSTLRQELMANLFRQDAERVKMAKRTSSIEKMLMTLNNVLLQQHTELRGDNVSKVATLKEDWQHVENKMLKFQMDVHQSMADMQRQVSEKVVDAQIGIDFVKEIVAKQHVELRGDNASKVATLKEDWQHVDVKLRGFQQEIHSSMSEMRDEVSSQVRDARMGIDYLKDIMTKLTTDVSILCERDYESKQRSRSMTRYPSSIFRLEPRKPDDKSVSQTIVSGRPSHDIQTSSTPPPDSSGNTTDTAPPQEDEADMSASSSSRYSGPFSEIINKILHDE